MSIAFADACFLKIPEFHNFETRSASARPATAPDHTDVGDNLAGWIQHITSRFLLALPYLRPSMARFATGS